MTQQVANPNNRILNIAKLPDYYGNDTEDPFKWIDTAKTTARANNWNEAKLLQIIPSAMKGTAQQWYQDAIRAGAFDAFFTNAHAALNPLEDAFLQHYASDHRRANWRLQLRSLTQGNMTVDQYTTKLKRLICRVDPDNLMRNDEKLFYLIAGASAVYQPFLLASGAATIDQAVDVMKNMETGASLITPAATIMALEAQISELKDQINTLNLNVNPSPDKIANPHRNEARYNREKRRDANKLPRQNMEEIVCHNCNQSGHYARYCHLPRDMSRVICDLCHQPGHFARNCFNNPSPTYAKTIPRNPPYNSYPVIMPDIAIYRET